MKGERGGREGIEKRCHHSIELPTFLQLFFPTQPPRTQKKKKKKKQPGVKIIIDGEKIDSKTADWIDVHDPATQAVVARTPRATEAEFGAAVAAAARAFPKWRTTPLPARQRVMLRLQALIRQHEGELAAAVTREQGKTLADARGDVFRGLEVVEYACGLAPSLMGSHLENVASGGVDCFSVRQPLGVVAGICPFNFPAMIPLWMFPIAVTAGNAFVLKPSERDPSAAVMLAELAAEAGLPPGVLNVVHGGHETVNRICDDSTIKAVAFVGSDAGGQHVYARASASGKRVQANMGAKNHAVVLPDAHREATLSALTGAAFGAAGQRCMAVSAAVFVGGVEPWAEELVERARALRCVVLFFLFIYLLFFAFFFLFLSLSLSFSLFLSPLKPMPSLPSLLSQQKNKNKNKRLGPGHEAGVDVGPMISPAALDRARSLISRSIDMGAVPLLDGRSPSPPLPSPYDRGNFMAPTILSKVRPGMPAYDEEVFGPALVCLDASSLEEAIAVTNANPHGNGAAIFTRSGGAARRFTAEVEAGMVGVNVPIPVPLPFFSFTGWKGSFAGDLHMYGKAGVDFFTRPKTVTSAWRSEDEERGGRAAGLDGVGAAAAK